MFYETLIKKEHKKMNDKEKALIRLLQKIKKEYRAIILQSYVQKNGPISKAAGDEVKRLL